MTQRDDAAVMVLHDPSESDERQSVTRPISSVRTTDEPVHEAQAEHAAAGSEPVIDAAAHEEHDADSASQLSSEVVEHAERPTLMGLAPVEIGSEVASSAAEQLNAAQEQGSDEQAAHQPETSTVRPAQWLTADAEPTDEAAAAHQDHDRDEAEEPEPESELEAEDSPSAEDEPEASADEEQEQLVAASASAESARAPLQISMFMPTPEHAARLPEEGESEWLDLSTRWLVTSGPRAAQPHPFVEETEVTDHAHWADRLSARVGARAEALSSAPPPPPQGTRRATRPTRPTIGYGRPVPGQAQILANEGAPTHVDARGQPQWAPPTRRHTLTGISPLPEEPNAWTQAREASAGDAARAIMPGGEPNPWREEPSYSDAPRPQGHGPSTTAASYAAPAGAMPPWAAPMSPYAAPPTAAMTAPFPPAQAAWTAPVAPPPWAATVNYGVPASQYAPPERRPSRRTPTHPTHRSHDYTLPPGASTGTGSLRPVRAPQQYANEISFEQWKGMANTWFMTVGKLALAGMALHFSGLATPLLANFGYAPAATEHILRPAVQTASLAAASVMPEPAAMPEPVEEIEPLVVPRRSSAKREPSPTTSTTTESATRRRSPKPAHKTKPKSSAHSKPARSSEAEAPAAAAVAPAATASAAEARVEAEPPAAAASKSADATGEGTLRINSRPWSEVYVDGIHVGHTPKLDLKVSAGSHRVRLVNQELGLTKTIELNAAAGQTVSHVELFIE